MIKIFTGITSFFSQELQIEAWWLVLFALPLISAFLWLAKVIIFKQNHTIDLFRLGIGVGSISIKPSAEDKTIAYKIWTEMSTRKIGLKIDLEYDVIVEIYSSWYDFFSITREHIKEVPYNKFKSKESQKIILLSINVLNKGLRPHLTKWQAKFTKWYDANYEILNGKLKKELKTPQEVQNTYPDFHNLLTDLKKTNSKLINYRNLLEKIAFGKRIT